MAACAGGLLASAGVGAAIAKEPGEVHCYNAICHRVLTLAETAAAVGAVDEVVASYYGAPDDDRYNPRLETSSGEVFDAERPDTAASPVLPDGTVVLVWYEETRRAAILRINNAGPYMADRRLDVSKAVADRLGFAQDGTAKLHLLVLAAPSAEEARYRRGRRYAAVDGMIGEFDSVAQAALVAPDPLAAFELRHARIGSASNAVQMVGRAIAKGTPAAPKANSQRADATTRSPLARRSRVAERDCDSTAWPRCALGD